VWNIAFWSSPRVEGSAPALPRLMVAATAVLVLLGTGLTVISGPLYSVTAETAGQLLDRQGYVQAVFDGVTP
jgi:multicomponent Na+:H+ antiporter subunit D